MLFSMFHSISWFDSLQPENILVNETRDTLKVADLGSARGVTHKKPFTEYIATRWYRAPECLITDGYYGAEMDVWGSGCVIFELVSLYPLFPGADETDQINRIHKIVGTPSPATVLKLQSQGFSSHSMKFQHQKGVGIKHFISHASPECVDLINQTLIYDYSERITSKVACEHAYFEEAARELNEKAKTPEVGRDAFLVGGKEKELNPPLAEKERNPQEPSTAIEYKRKKPAVVNNNEGKKDHTIKVRNILCHSRCTSTLNLTFPLLFTEQSIKTKTFWTKRKQHSGSTAASNGYE
jgi:serine/threonine protein kinase